MSLFAPSKEEIKSLSYWDKLKIYLYYYNIQIGLKHDFEFVDIIPRPPRKKIKVNLPEGFKVISQPTKGVILDHPTAPPEEKDDPLKGWGKPDKQIGNIAIFYLWQHHAIYTFEEFVETGIYSFYPKFYDKINLQL